MRPESKRPVRLSAPVRWGLRLLYLLLGAGSVLLFHQFGGMTWLTLTAFIGFFLLCCAELR